MKIGAELSTDHYFVCWIHRTEYQRDLTGTLPPLKEGLFYSQVNLRTWSLDRPCLIIDAATRSSGQKDVSAWHGSNHGRTCLWTPVDWNAVKLKKKKAFQVMLSKNCSSPQERP